MSEKFYDSLVIFPSPLYLPKKGNTDWTNVYGILFNRVSSYPEDIDYYVGYLQGCHNFLKNGGKIEDEKWKTYKSEYEETTHLFTLVSMTQYKNYKVILSDEPIEIKDGEMDGGWMISKELIERTMKDLPN